MPNPADLLGSLNPWNIVSEALQPLNEGLTPDQIRNQGVSTAMFGPLLGTYKGQEALAGGINAVGQGPMGPILGNLWDEILTDRAARREDRQFKMDQMKMMMEMDDRRRAEDRRGMTEAAMLLDKRREASRRQEQSDNILGTLLQSLMAGPQVGNLMGMLMAPTPTAMPTISGGLGF